MTLDDIRVSNVDVFGPRVTAQSPAGEVAGAGLVLQVTFNEAIDPATFTAGDVTVTGPAGNAVALAATNPIVDSGDHQTFTINFASAQSLAGTYTFTVGPDVRDAAGNWMNQNDNAVNGESGDAYSGTFRIGPVAAQAFPYVQDFESGDITALAGWDFAVSSGGTWSLTSGNSPHGGTYALRPVRPARQSARNARCRPEAGLCRAKRLRQTWNWTSG